MKLKTSGFRVIFILIFCSFYLQALHAQEKKGRFADQVIIGTGLSAIRDAGGIQDDLIHWEYTAVANASLRLTKIFHIGFEYRFIHTSGSSTSVFPPPPTTYNMYGIFTQLDFLNYKGLRFFGQLSYDRGNYCGCIGTRNPFKVEDLNYFGWGIGVNYRIHKYVSIDASFMYDYVLNPGEYNPYAYTYWALGVNYDLDRSM